MKDRLNMYKIVLTQISSKHDNLRTKTIEGVTHFLPEVGEGFMMHGDPLQKGEGYIRIVHTTDVLTVERLPSDGELYEFTTKNSAYQIRVLEKIF